MFSHFFGKTKTANGSNFPWQTLTNLTQLGAIVEASNHKPLLIFKHSTRCGISRMVLSQFEADYDITINADLHYLDLLSHRDISNAIAQRFNVVHQSPQLLIIKNENVIAHASHGAINEMDITNIQS